MAFRFSKRSRDNLATCDPALQDLFGEVIQHWDCTVVCGHRGEAAQNDAYARGMSHLRWPDSKHNSLRSLAVDVVPYPIDWMDHQRFYYFAGFVLGVARSMRIDLRHGGDWDRDRFTADERFRDLPHFELV